MFCLQKRYRFLYILIAREGGDAKRRHSRCPTVRAEVAFCDGREPRRASGFIRTADYAVTSKTRSILLRQGYGGQAELTTSKARGRRLMAAKKTLKGGFRCKKLKKTAILTVFDLINPGFDDILYDADGYPGTNSALMAVCCMPDFPDAASLPAHAVFA